MKKFHRALTARTAAAAATLIFSLAGTASAVSAAPSPVTHPVQTVQQAAALPTSQTNGKNFVGLAYATRLFSATAETPVYGALVYFTPGARTNWHIHSRTQTLIVTEGVGYTQEWGKPVTVIRPGDVVQCPAGVKHWHGGTATTSMSHIAISEPSPEGVTWLEPVSDEQYPREIPE